VVVTVSERDLLSSRQWLCPKHHRWEDENSLCRFNEIRNDALYVSPSERAHAHLGISSSLPEQYGVDFLWASELGTVGVQRKQFPGDFLASVHDGRLNREYAMMKELDLAVLLLEGQQYWTSEGNLVRDRNDSRYQWSLTQHRNYLASVQMRGVQVHSSNSHTDTEQFLLDMQLWTNKRDHSGLSSRPAARGRWGDINNHDYYEYLLQSLPGVGPKQAAAIRGSLGVILKPVVSAEELMTVPGIGKGRAEAILKVFADDG
jgi:ERCC4-type nuclease